MGCSIKFVRLDDFAADVDSLDLSTNGYSLMNDGYFQVAAPIGVKSVHEVITLKLQGTSKDDLAAMTQEIDEKIKQVQWWLDNQPVEKYQIWIRVQLDGETYPRQAQIINITPPDKVKVFTPVEINANYLGEYQIGIERTAFWEDPYPYPTTTAKTGINSLGGAVDLSETINGDVPARLARLDFSPAPGKSYGMFWAGWRTNRFGTPANFVPVWDLSSGTPGTDTTSGADGTAYGSNALTCTFATVPTLAQRAVVQVSNVTANYADQTGQFVVLLRAQMSDTSIARVRAKFGWVNSITADINSPIIMSRQVISGTGWVMLEMGKVNLPPVRNTVVTLENFSISIDAERISGGGSLLMDCLVLIPSAEGFIKIETASNITDHRPLHDSMAILTRADMTVTGIKITSDYTPGFLSYDTVTLTPINWSLPANGTAPRLIVCGATYDGGNFAGNNLEMSYTYIPRWRTLRGNST